MRDEISWHQLVEWYQFYLSNPFGEERADLRSAIAGCAIANEVRSIAGGLAGKRLKPIQVKDLLLNPAKRGKGGATKDNDYYKQWEASIKQELATYQKSKKPGKRTRNQS